MTTREKPPLYARQWFWSGKQWAALWKARRADQLRAVDQRRRQRKKAIQPNDPQKGK